MPDRQYDGMERRAREYAASSFYRWEAFKQNFDPAKWDIAREFWRNSCQEFANAAVAFARTEQARLLREIAKWSQRELEAVNERGSDLHREGQALAYWFVREHVEALAAEIEKGETDERTEY